MGFVKRILLIDFKGQGESVRVGAVLLNKDALKEKDSFVS